MDQEYDPFSQLTGESPLAAKRLKNPMVKGNSKRYNLSDEEWDPFQNLLGRQSALWGTSGEEFLYPSEESEENFPVELDSDWEML